MNSCVLLKVRYLWHVQTVPAAAASIIRRQATLIKRTPLVSEKVAVGATTSAVTASAKAAAVAAAAAAAATTALGGFVDESTPNGGLRRLHKATAETTNADQRKQTEEAVSSPQRWVGGIEAAFDERESKILGFLEGKVTSSGVGSNGGNREGVYDGER